MAQINEWLSITQTEGKGDATITLTASSSRELQERVQSLQITTQTKTNYLNIKQKAFAPSITLSNTELAFTNILLQNTTTIISNVEWSVVPSANWINISQLSGESGTTTLIVDVTSINSPTENRTGYIDFYWGDELMKTVEIKQEFEVVFELSKNNVTITNETIATINVTSNTTWYCKSDNEWVIINPTTLNGSGVITITASEYDGVERTGSINFYVGDKKVDSLTIKQLYLPEDVEIPEDITGCFYIEPYDNNNSVSISFYDKYNTTTISSGQYGAFEYYQNNEWKKIGIENSGGYIHTFNDNYLEFSKRVYFRNPTLTSYMKISFSGEFNMGGVFKFGSLEEFFIDTSIVNAKNLILSDTLTASYCYARAFQNCKKLITAPQLPATSLPSGAYTSMFQGCINLIKSPIELPATALSEECYINMFAGCTSLTTVPELPATTLTQSCYSNMFSGCTSLTTAPELPATTLATKCYYSMFRGCSSLTTAPELPATKLQKSCYSSMFEDCSSLTTAPELPATTLAEYCYNYMFSDCSNLNYIKSYAKYEITEDNLNRWLSNVSPTGTFVKQKIARYPTGEDGIPSGWTIQLF